MPLALKDALFAQTVFVLTDESGIDAIRKSTETLRSESTKSIENSTVSVQDSGDGTIQAQLTQETSDGTESVNKLSLSGLSLSSVDVVSNAAMTRILRPFTSTTPIQTASYLRYLSSSESAIKTLMLSSTKRTSACCFVAIATPNGTSLNWQELTSATSPSILTISSEGISIGVYSLKGGREYGVLSVSAPTYAEQLHIACATVVHRLWSYPGNPLTTAPTGKLRVSDAWVAWFASIWAPQGVVNDPSGLNKNWVKDFLAAYLGFL